MRRVEKYGEYARLLTKTKDCKAFCKLNQWRRQGAPCYTGGRTSRRNTVWHCYRSTTSKKSTPPASAAIRCGRCPMFRSRSSRESTSPSWASRVRERPPCSTFSPPSTSRRAVRCCSTEKHRFHSGKGNFLVPPEKPRLCVSGFQSAGHLYVTG